MKEVKKVSIDFERKTVEIGGIEYEFAEKKPSIEGAKKELIEILDSLEGWHDFKKYPNNLFWKKDGEVVMKLDGEDNNLWVAYDSIWSIIESKYYLKQYEVKDLIEDVVAEHWKIEGVTANRASF